MRKKCIHATKAKRGPYPNPMRKRVDYQFSSEGKRAASLKRHPWYRRKLAWDALRAVTSHHQQGE